MAEVTAAGFLEDDAFGNFIHPHRKDFPEDWDYFWQKEIRSHLMKARSRNYVCIESASGKVAAICLEAVLEMVKKNKSTRRPWTPKHSELVSSRYTFWAKRRG
jgi:hypothetical protein